MTARQFLHALLLLSVTFTISGTTGDPDLWGHVRFGQDMLDHGAIRLPDTYSFTSDQTWINHEWLAELLMAIAFNQLGPIGLNLLRIAVIAGILTLVWVASRGIAERRRVMLIAAAALGIYLRVHPVRPQMFSILMFACLLTLLERVDDRHSLTPLVWIPIVLAGWVNLHGGWVVGIGFFALWSVARAVSNGRERVAIGCAFGAALGATLANPYGLSMWSFLAETVRLERPMIADWQPLYTLPPLLWTFWLAGAGVLAIAARVSPREAWPHVAIVAALGIAALRVSRLDAFFALAAVFLATSVLSKGEPGFVRSPHARRSPVFAALLVLCLIPISYVVAKRIAAVPVPSHLMPDSNVAAYVRDTKLSGTALTWFDWGQYSIWHFGPELKVSMDGRRETVYSPEVVDAHFRFYFGTADEWRYVDVVNADYVWVPKHLPVVRQLQRHGWHRACDGNSSILLARQRQMPSCSPNPSGGDRLFPQL